MDYFDQIIRTANWQKGELLALRCLLVSIVRALPLHLQGVVLAEFDTEREAAKVVLLNYQSPEDVLIEFDRTVEAINALRLDRPRN